MAMSSARLIASAIALAGAAMTLLLAVAGAGETVLVRDGVPLACIVLPANPSELERVASEELQTDIISMSGAEIPILGGQQAEQGVPIFIGGPVQGAGLEEVRAGGEDPASFRLRASQDGIELIGLSDEGTLFAVYELLEQLGVRWFMPGEIGTVIPGNKTVAVAWQDTVQHPAFAGRLLSDMPGESGAEWSRRMRLGGFDAGGHGFPFRADPSVEPELFVHENGRPTGQLRVSNPRRCSGGPSRLVCSSCGRSRT